MLGIADTPSPSPSPPPPLSDCEEPSEVVPQVTSHGGSSTPTYTSKLCLNDAVSVPASLCGQDTTTHLADE
eukprot:9451462-Prorocentrum_lima.AAC.1